MPTECNPKPFEFAPVGSLKQRYAIRHAIGGKGVEIRHLCRISSPNLAPRFHGEILGWQSSGLPSCPDRGRPLSS
jgi:hypothetical protein